MDTSQRDHRPGDLIIDRYMPNASEDEREAARESLRRLARILIRIEDRLAQEWYERRTREPGEGAVKCEERDSPRI